MSGMSTTTVDIRLGASHPSLLTRCLGSLTLTLPLIPEDGLKFETNGSEAENEATNANSIGRTDPKKRRSCDYTQKGTKRHRMRLCECLSHLVLRQSHGRDASFNMKSKMFTNGISSQCSPPYEAFYFVIMSLGRLRQAKVKFLRMEGPPQKCQSKAIQSRLALDIQRHVSVKLSPYSISLLVHSCRRFLVPCLSTT